MKKPLVWAHRGASGYAPENTLEAFQKALDLKADGIELDVQMTKDGQLVIIHDETVDRVSNVSGWVKDFTWEQLKELNINKTFRKYGKLKIPTLKEVFHLIKNTELVINVEIKNGIVFYENVEEKIMELSKKMGLQERIIYSSFNHYSIMKLKKLDPSVNTGFLYADGYLNMPEYALNHGVQALHPALYNVQYPNFLSDCKANNIDVRVWTVNETEHMEMLCQNGVNAIITNYPDIAREVVDKYERKTRNGI